MMRGPYPRSLDRPPTSSYTRKILLHPCLILRQHLPHDLPHERRVRGAEHIRVDLVLIPLAISADRARVSHRRETYIESFDSTCRAVRACPRRSLRMDPPNH